MQLHCRERFFIYQQCSLHVAIAQELTRSTGTTTTSIVLRRRPSEEARIVRELSWTANCSHKLLLGQKSQEDTGELLALQGPLRLPVKRGDHCARGGDTDARCCHAGRIACQCLLANYGSTTYQPPTLSPLSGSLTTYTIRDPTPLHESPALSLFSLPLALSVCLSPPGSIFPSLLVLLSSSSFLFVFSASTNACTTYRRGLMYLRKTQTTRQVAARCDFASLCLTLVTP